MPPKRQGLPKKAKNKSTALFDFLNDITFDKQNILNRENKSQYSRFMITKFLSMNANYLPIVDAILNKYQGVLDDEQFHKLCIGLIPKKKIFLKYNKGKPRREECKESISYISNYFEVSDDTAFEYFELGGEKLVNDIKKLYGVNG